MLSTRAARGLGWAERNNTARQHVRLRRDPIAPSATDVLLAHTADDAPLTPEHGFPLRLVVPGIDGRTQCKVVRRNQ